MNPAVANTLRSPSARLRRAYRTVHRAVDAAVARFGATADQFAVRRLVSQAEGVTQRELSDLLASDPNTVAAMVARLEKQGLILRRPHQRNAKAQSIYLTPAGRCQLAKLMEAMKPVRVALSACFAGEDGEKGLATLDRVYRTATKLGNSQAQGERQ